MEECVDSNTRRLAAEPVPSGGTRAHAQTWHATGTRTRPLQCVQRWSGIWFPRSLDFSKGRAAARALSELGTPPALEACSRGKRAPAPRIRRRGALPPSPATRALLAVPAARSAACKMSVRRGRRPAGAGTRLSWLLCCSALLSPAAGYVIVSSVSWAVTNEVDEELDSASTEEAMPALLEDSGSIWQRSFPASAHKEDAHLPPPAGGARARPPPAPPGMFSYPREGGPRLRPGTARFLAHASAWGCLATVSAHDKVSPRAGSRWQAAGACLAVAWPPDGAPRGQEDASDHSCTQIQV